MRKILLFFIMSAFITGCQQESEWSSIKISGSISNPNIEYLKFYPFETFANNERLLQEVPLQQDSTFSLTYRCREPLPAMLAIDDKQYMFFLEPGYDIRIEVDSTNDIKVTKDNQNNNEVFLEYQEKFSPYFRPDLNYQLSSEKFVSQINSMNQSKEEFLSNNREKISNSLAKYLENDIIYHGAKEKIYYARRFKRQLVKEKNDYFSFLQGIEIQNNEAVNNVNYLSFISNFINYQFLKEIFTDNFDYKSQNVVMDSIAKSRLSGAVLKQFQAENIILGIRDEWDKAAFRKVVHEFLAGTESEQLKNLVNRRLKKYHNAPIAKGKKAPAFSLRNREDEVYSLSDFRGKYVVIDFWASWCGPCRKAIPQMLKIKKNFNNTARFVFISIDQNLQNWRNVSNELAIPEPSLIIDDKTRQNYGFDKVISVPFYLVLDKQARVVLRNPNNLKEIEKFLKNHQN